MAKYEIKSEDGLVVDTNTDPASGNILEVKKQGVTIAAIDKDGNGSGGFAGGGGISVAITALPSPSGSFTNATYTGFYSITNGIMSLEYLVDMTGTPAAANLTVDLPAGYSIDTTKLVTNPEGINWLNGQGYAVDTSVNNYAHMAIAVNSPSSLRMFYGDGDTLLGQVSNSAPFAISTGDYVWLSVTFPVI